MTSSKLTVGTYFLVELTEWILLWSKVNECIWTESFIKTCTLNGCECVLVVGMLFVSIVFLELLSFSLIICIQHRNLVGGVFFYLLLTSVKVCVEIMWVKWPLLRSCHYSQCIRSKLSYSRSLIFSQKTIVSANRRPILLSFTEIYTTKKKTVIFF